MKQGKTPPLFWVRDEEQGCGGEGKGLLASRKAGKMPLVFELEQNRAALLALHARLDSLGAQCDDMYAAFITFADEAGRRACLDSVSVRDYMPLIGNSSRGAKLKHAAITPAPEVSNVSWENLQYSRGNRLARTALVLLLAAILLAGEHSSMTMRAS